MREPSLENVKLRVLGSQWGGHDGSNRVLVWRPVDFVFAEGAWVTSKSSCVQGSASIAVADKNVVITVTSENKKQYIFRGELNTEGKVMAGDMSCSGEQQHYSWHGRIILNTPTLTTPTARL